MLLSAQMDVELLDSVACDAAGETPIQVVFNPRHRLWRIRWRHFRPRGRRGGDWNEVAVGNGRFGLHPLSGR